MQETRLRKSSLKNKLRGGEGARINTKERDCVGAYSYHSVTITICGQMIIDQILKVYDFRNGRQVDVFKSVSDIEVDNDVVAEIVLKNKNIPIEIALQGIIANAAIQRVKARTTE